MDPGSKRLYGCLETSSILLQEVDFHQICGSVGEGLVLALGPGFHPGASSCSCRSFCPALLIYKTLTHIFPHRYEIMPVNGASGLWDSKLKRNEHAEAFDSLSPIR